MRNTKLFGGRINPSRTLKDYLAMTKITSKYIKESKSARCNEILGLSVYGGDM